MSILRHAKQVFELRHPTSYLIGRLAESSLSQGKSHKFGLHIEQGVSSLLRDVMGCKRNHLGSLALNVPLV